MSNSMEAELFRVDRRMGRRGKAKNGRFSQFFEITKKSVISRVTLFAILRNRLKKRDQSRYAFRSFAKSPKKRDQLRYAFRNFAKSPKKA